MLIVEDNRLSSLGRCALSSRARIRSVSLIGNVLVCDCRVAWVGQLSTIPQQAPPTCCRLRPPATSHRLRYLRTTSTRVRLDSLSLFVVRINGLASRIVSYRSSSSSSSSSSSDVFECIGETKLSCKCRVAWIGQLSTIPPQNPPTCRRLRPPAADSAHLSCKCRAAWVGQLSTVLGNCVQDDDATARHVLPAHKTSDYVDDRFCSADTAHSCLL